ncbi:unnamed protein product [Ectocarpus sp. 6 AP-2014]
MGISIMKLVTLWLVASAETLRVHGASAAAQGAKGVQGRESGKKVSKQQQRAQAAAAKDVCSVGDSPATCRELTAKYRGGAAATSGGEKMSLNVMKILLQVCLTTLNVVCWLVPMKIRSFVESKRAISMANAFSGGVFLSLAFGHMMPHATLGFEESGLPANVPYFLTLSGYMLIFFVEKVAFDAHNIMHEGDGHGQQQHGGGKTVADGSSVAAVAAGGGEGGVAAGGNSGRSAIILLLALGVHALMETMALGLSSNRVSAGLLAMSIGLHQPAESLALLVSFLKSGLSERQVIKYLSIFSCLGPAGLGLGIAISEFAGKLADAVMVAMAAGTFIYVGATEVIAEEFESPHDKWKKFSALTAGIVIIAYVTHWAESLEHMA